MQRQQEVEEPETRFLPFGAEAGPVSPEEYDGRMRRLQSGDWRRHVRPQQQTPQQAQQPQPWTEQQREQLRRVHAGNEGLRRDLQALNAEVTAHAADMGSRAQGAACTITRPLYCNSCLWTSCFQDFGMPPHNSRPVVPMLTSGAALQAG